MMALALFLWTLLGEILSWRCRSRNAPGVWLPGQRKPSEAAGAWTRAASSLVGRVYNLHMKTICF